MLADLHEEGYICKYTQQENNWEDHKHYHVIQRWFIVRNFRFPGYQNLHKAQPYNQRTIVCTLVFVFYILQSTKALKMISTGGNVALELCDKQQLQTDLQMQLTRWFSNCGAINSFDTSTSTLASINLGKAAQQYLRSVNTDWEQEWIFYVTIIYRAHPMPQKRLFTNWAEWHHETSRRPHFLIQPEKVLVGRIPCELGFSLSLVLGNTDLDKIYFLVDMACWLRMKEYSQFYSL